MTLHLFLTLTLAVACVALAWAWWDQRRTCRATHTPLSTVTSWKLTGDAVVDVKTLGAPEPGTIVHFPSWMPDPPGPQIDHLGRERS